VKRSKIAAPIIFILATRWACAQDPSPSLAVQAGGSECARGGGGGVGGNGRWMATFFQQTVCIVDPKNGTLLRRIPGPKQGEIAKLAADPVGDRIALGMSDGSVSVTDIARDQQLWQNARLPAAKNELTTLSALRFTSDGTKVQQLVTLTLPKMFSINPKSTATLYVWDAATGKAIEERAIPFPVSRFSSDGGWLISETIHGIRNVQYSTTVIDAATGAPVGSEIDGYILDAHAGTGRALVKSFSGSAGSSQSAWSAFRIVDVAANKTITTLSSDLTSGHFSPDGRTLVMAGPKVRWQVIDAATGAVTSDESGSVPSPIEASGASSPDGTSQQPLSAATQALQALANQMSKDYEAGILDSEKMEKEYKKRGLEVMKMFGAGPGAGPAAFFTADGRWLIARSADGQLDFFDAATGNRLPFRIDGSPDSSEPLSASASGRYVYLKSATLAEKQKVQVKSAFKKTELETRKHTSSFSTETVDTLIGKVSGKVDFQDVRCFSAGGEFAVELPEDVSANTLQLSGWGGYKLKHPAGGQKPTLHAAAGGTATELPATINFSAGCSVSPDGKYLVVADAIGKGTVQAMGGTPEMFGIGKTALKESLEIYDIAGHHTAGTILDPQGKTAKLPFAASSVRWSGRGDLLIGGGGGNALYGASTHGPVRIWEAATGRQLRELPGSDTFDVLGISPDASLIFTKKTDISARSGRFDSLPNGLQGYGIDVRDSVSGAIRYSLPGALAQSDLLAFSPDGKVIAGPDRDGALSIWSRSDGTLLGQLRAFQEGEWLITSSVGLFDGSPRGWSLISWHDPDNALQTVSGEIYFNEFYRPGLLADLLDGHRPTLSRPITSIDRRQPSLTISATAGSEGMASVRIIATEAAAAKANKAGSGVKDLRLFRNGLLVKAWHGDLRLDSNGSATVEATVQAPPGENHFSAYAFNADNVRSTEASAILKSLGTPGKGALYVVAIGVNEYANSEFNLKYAVPDADSLSRELAGRQESLAQFASIRRVTLKDQRATAANIRYVLGRLSGENSGPPPAGLPADTAALTPVGPEDTLVLYFAGHGMASGDRFYLIPHDLGYAGPRAQVRDHLSEVLDHGISDLDLQRALEPVMARHIVLIIDACQSGQALASDDDRRGPMNSRGLAQLAWEKGMSILAASQAYQAALESSRLGHGFLTFALAEEALKTSVADTAPLDGLITETEWLQYAVGRVPQLQIDAMENVRQANRTLTLEVRPGDIASSRLQSPRLFTRRDLPGAPLVVAKF